MGESFDEVEPPRHFPSDEEVVEPGALYAFSVPELDRPDWFVGPTTAELTHANSLSTFPLASQPTDASHIALGVPGAEISDTVKQMIVGTRQGFKES